MTGDSPSYPENHRRSRLTWRATSAAPTNSCPPPSSCARVIAPTPATAAIHCKTELYGTLSRAGARARLRRRRRRHQRRRSRRLPSGPRKAAREHGVRSPLDEAGLTKDDIRALARALRHVQLGRAGVGLPVVAHSAPQSKSRADKLRADRAGRRRRSARWASACSACVTTTRWRGSRSRATKWRGRWSRRSTGRLVADAQGRRLPARQPRPAGLPAGQPERTALAAAGAVSRRRAPSPRPDGVVAALLLAPAWPPAILRRCRPPSKTSTR